METNTTSKTNISRSQDDRAQTAASPMRSNWPGWDRKHWNRHQRIIDRLNLYPVSRNKTVPIHSKTDKVPYMTQWSLHRWVILHSAIPLLLEQAYASYAGHPLGPMTTFCLYLFSFYANTLHQIYALRRLAHKHGFLDAQHERDGIPNTGATTIIRSFHKSSISRTALLIFLTYHPTQSPSTINPTSLLLGLTLHPLLLDLWFYWYHRLLHEIPFLWRFHRTHHLTRHPNALLSAFADDEQQLFDMLAVPLATYLSLSLIGLRLSFHELWIIYQYLIFAEIMGHSGLRVYVSPPYIFFWLLRACNVEGINEDHDLHHRLGWRKSHRYSKHSALWDWVFGTLGDGRVECTEGNIDFVNPARMPLL